jgi:hypothetical protein
MKMKQQSMKMKQQSIDEAAKYEDVTWLNTGVSVYS